MARAIVLAALAALVAGCLQPDMPNAPPRNEDPPLMPEARRLDPGFSPAVNGTAQFPSPCIGPPVPDRTATSAPSAARHCVPSRDLVVDGRSLGFTDDYAVDWIRPGINIAGCTASYLLADDAGGLYLTLAAHCIYDGAEQPTYCDSEYDAIGTSYRIQGHEHNATLTWVSGRHMDTFPASEDECDSWDAAVLRLPDEARSLVHPAIRHIGGPVGLADPLDLSYGDAATGYGNSDDRGAAVERATGNDHGNAPVWPMVNVFHGTFLGGLFAEAGAVPEDVLPNCDWDETPYCYGHMAYFRYAPPKITGDSGSPDLTAEGLAVGMTSNLHPAGVTGSSVLYDTLLRIWEDLGVRLRLVTWDEWSPDTLETGP
jgi:hypothetical protein